MSDYHRSVLLQEVVDGLQIKPGEKYIDATMGAAGHTQAILDRGGIVLALDQDKDAIEYVQQELRSKSQELRDRLKIIQGNFAKIGEIAQENDFTEVSGILFDLGVSSHQLDSAERGFSFLQEAPLDMRMDQKLAITAKDLVNGLNKGELMELFTKYGEEPFAKRIAQKIVEERETAPITTTTKLARLIAKVYPRGNHKVHPATKVFQALRIAVNDELVSLESALPQAMALLKGNGRLCVISFHSLEDRIVKYTFAKWQKEGLGKIITEKPIEPTEEEREENRRSRSSKLRIFQKNRGKVL